MVTTMSATFYTHFTLLLITSSTHTTHQKWDTSELNTVQYHRATIFTRFNLKLNFQKYVFCVDQLQQASSLGTTAENRVTTCQVLFLCVNSGACTDDFDLDSVCVFVKGF